MKAKSTIPKKGKVVEPPVTRLDRLPGDLRHFKGDPLEASLAWPAVMGCDDGAELPLIHQTELMDLDNAKLHLQMAQADYEKIRANIVWKLVHRCRVAQGDVSVWLDSDGQFHCVENRRSDMREREE